MSELKETKKMKVFQPYPDHEYSPLGPQKLKNEPKLKLKSNVRIERNK